MIFKQKVNDVLKFTIPEFKFSIDEILSNNNQNPSNYEAYLNTLYIEFVIEICGEEE